MSKAQTSPETPKRRRIEPRTLQGFSDYLPKQMVTRRYVENTLRKVFESFGYGELQTPCLEYQEILTGKYGEDEKLIYKFTDNGDRKVALRYDLTVPLARVIGQHQNEITLPFKRYHIEKVWRADSPRKGRKREFYQCDVDIVGVANIAADAEILLILHTGFAALGLDDHIIMLNNRQITNAFIRTLNIPEDKAIEVFRSIDKYDKVGLEGVEKELKERGIEQKNIPEILEFIDCDGKSNQQILEQAESRVGSDPDGQKGIEQIKSVLEILEHYGVPEKNIRFNLRLARGLDYYTSLVFEVLVPKFGGMSLAGGGRYGELCGLFAGKEITATGVAFGFEPICAALEEFGLGPKLHVADVLVTVFGEAYLRDSLEISQKLRAAGLKVELYPDPTAKLGKQFKYADANNIPYAIVIGEDEKKKKEVMLKNMQSGEQETVNPGELIKRLAK
ncbi:MAG: histidine--tRNA ligase [Candidatus Gracilibacteria bacterium]|nr:histidine--tRNA ligase [Candidatus Gracilibacteria bacterium]